MKFTATDSLARQIAANAVNASTPRGMGILHYRPEHVFLPQEIEVDPISGDIELDYVEGRMVKLDIYKVGENEYQTPDRPATPDYQSWHDTYPTYEALVKSVIR